MSPRKRKLMIKKIVSGKEEPSARFQSFVSKSCQNKCSPEYYIQRPLRLGPTLYLFTCHLLNIYNVPSLVLDPGDTEIAETLSVPSRRLQAGAGKADMESNDSNSEWQGLGYKFLQGARVMLRKGTRTTCIHHRRLPGRGDHLSLKNCW